MCSRRRLLALPTSDESRRELKPEPDADSKHEMCAARSTTTVAVERRSTTHVPQEGDVNRASDIVTAWMLSRTPCVVSGYAAEAARMQNVGAGMHCASVAQISQNRFLVGAQRSAQRTLGHALVRRGCGTAILRTTQSVTWTASAALEEVFRCWQFLDGVALEESSACRRLTDVRTDGRMDGRISEPYKQSLAFVPEDSAMSDHGPGRVHRFRDHVIAGVNWRPTRFVDDIPSSRLCNLCRMIPKRTVLLPCGHVLCQSCHAASLEGGVGRCPLDQAQFEEPECFRYEFPTRIANTLKVYCWNEAHGCEYTGTMDRVLEHYENECTFHTVECLRCGEGVQHRDLPAHYAAGCSASVSSGITECPSSERTALSLEDVNAAFEELEARLGDAIHDRLLPEIQTHFNELKEQVRSQQTMFAGITRDIGASERNLNVKMDQITATISATVSHQMTSLQNPVEEASTSTSLSLHSEHDLILRMLEHLALVENLRQNSPKPESIHVIVHCSILEGDCRHLCSVLSNTAARIKRIGKVMYDLILENSEEIINYEGRLKKFAEITVLHMRDTYFTVAIYKWSGIALAFLKVEIEFNGMLVDSRCVPPFWQVSVWDNAVQKHRLFTSRATSCCCDRYDESLRHFHLEFQIAIPFLLYYGAIRDETILFQICLSDEEMDGSVKGGP